MRDIARALKRSVSTISDEIKRNSVSGSYDPTKAHLKARVRRKYAKYQGMKIVSNRRLQAFVERRLYDDQSPEAIAGRLKRKRESLPSVSKNSVYRYIKSVYGRRIEARRRKRKQRRRGRRTYRGKKLSDRTFIDKRPKYIEKRHRIGDAETDFIVSGRSGKGILLVVTDRKSRASFLERISKVTIVNINQAFQRIKKRFPEMGTVTTDNDILLQKHKELEKLLGIRIFFCHPYHAWEKGTVENTNKYIRRDIAKGSSITSYSSRFIHNLERKLNRRILKCLDYRTPQELLTEIRKRKKRRSARERNKKDWCSD